MNLGSGLSRNADRDEPGGGILEMPVYSWGMFWKKAQATTEQAANGTQKCPAPWYAKLGILAFTFFLLKGLLWLTVPAVLAYLGSR